MTSPRKVSAMVLAKMLAKVSAILLATVSAMILAMVSAKMSAKVSAILSAKAKMSVTMSAMVSDCGGLPHSASVKYYSRGTPACSLSNRSQSGYSINCTTALTVLCCTYCKRT